MTELDFILEALNARGAIGCTPVLTYDIQRARELMAYDQYLTRAVDTSVDSDEWAGG